MEKNRPRRVTTRRTSLTSSYWRVLLRVSEFYLRMYVRIHYILLLVSWGLEAWPREMVRTLLLAELLSSKRPKADDSASVCDWPYGSLPPRFLPGCRAREPYAPASRTRCTCFEAKKHYQRDIYIHFREICIAEEKVVAWGPLRKGSQLWRVGESLLFQ